MLTQEELDRLKSTLFSFMHNVDDRIALTACAYLTQLAALPTKSFQGKAIALLEEMRDDIKAEAKETKAAQ